MQANILQPLTDVATVALRQDALAELLGAGNDNLVHGARQCLASMPRDLDRMAAGLVRWVSWCPRVCIFAYP